MTWCQVAEVGANLDDGGKLDARTVFVAALSSLWLLAAGACDPSEPAAPWPPPHVHHARDTFVFFGSGSAVPTPGGLGELYRAFDGTHYVARQILLGDSTGKICVDGYADTVGSEAENLRLSKRRAEWVADYLISAGVAKDRLVVRAYGSSTPFLQTPPNKPEPQNRAVRIQWLDCSQA